MASGYVVTLSQPAVKDVVVTLSYAGTATDGSDFVRVASITVAAGQSQASFSISTLDDALAEGAEQFTVRLARVEAPGFEATASIRRAARSRRRSPMTPAPAAARLRRGHLPVSSAVLAR